MPTKTRETIEAPVAPEEQAYAVGDIDTYSLHEEESADDQPLTGDDLLAFYRDKFSEGMEFREIAYQAGYFSISHEGAERINVAQFQQAMLEASGIPLPKGKGKGPRRSSGLSKARVTTQGSILVSKVAVARVDAVIGQVFEVSFPADDQILLTRTDTVIQPVSRQKGSGEEQAAG